MGVSGPAIVGELGGANVRIIRWAAFDVSAGFGLPDRIGIAGFFELLPSSVPRLFLGGDFFFHEGDAFLGVHDTRVGELGRRGERAEEEEKKVE